jgi:hypothetical protein
MRCWGVIVFVTAFAGLTALCLRQPDAVMLCLSLEFPAAAALFLLWRLKPGSTYRARGMATALAVGHDAVAAHVAWLNSDGIDMICSTMRCGGMGGTHGYEYPEYVHTSLAEAYAPHEIEPLADDPWVRYARERDALRWQC